MMASRLVRAVWSIAAFAADAYLAGSSRYAFASAYSANRYSCGLETDSVAGGWA